MNLTPQQKQIFRVIHSCRPHAIDTSLILERLHWLNRHTLKAQICYMRRKGVPIVGQRGGAHYGGYRYDTQRKL